MGEFWRTGGTPGSDIDTPPGLSPDPYPHFTSEGEQRDKHLPTGFADTASPATGSSNQAGHLACGPDTRPSVPLPARTPRRSGAQGEARRARLRARAGAHHALAPSDPPSETTAPAS